MKAWIMKLLRRTSPGGMDCHEVGELLQHYLDGHTTPNGRGASRPTSKTAVDAGWR